MVVQITGYGGINEIGGSKLLLEDGARRIFFDFGMPFGRYGDYFDGVFIKERSARGLLDLLSLGILPPLRGLLREDLIPGLDPAALDVTTILPTGRQKNPRDAVKLPPGDVDAFWDGWQRRFPKAFRDLRREGAPAVDMVLLSHAHQDHISDCVYLAPDVPAASTRLTAFIAKVLADTGMAGQGAPYCNPYVLDRNGALTVDRNGVYGGRPWVFVDGDPGPDMGDEILDTAASFWTTSAASSKDLAARTGLLPAGLVVRHWPVDHSIFGATGYAVETSAGWVAYTGDMRMHGKHGAHTRAFAEALQALQPVALLCEGTRLDALHSTTEEEAHANCLRAVQDAGGRLVVADFAPRNVERLEAFIDIAAQTQRLLALQPKDAYLLRAMHLADPERVSDWMAHSNVALYADPKTVLHAWETGVRQRYAGRLVSHITVSAHPGDYILAFSLNDAPDLVDIFTLLPDREPGVYVFSNSPAYDDEQRADLARLWRWCRHLGLRLIGLQGEETAPGEVKLTSVPGYHASGHGDQGALVDFVKTVRPKTLIPIHTEVAHLWADLLAGTGIAITIPEFFKPIVLG